MGLKYFKQFISDPWFWRILKNTIVLNLWMLVLYFPTPIILALVLNELKNKWFKKAAQTISYMPYFLSTVVVCGFITTILQNDGLVNQMLTALGLEKIQFLMEPGWFRPIYVISEIWQQCGWGSIIYLSALAGVDSQLYEAAAIDGASKWKQLIHVSLPGIAPVISIQFLLTVGKLLTVGYEKILLLYTGATYETADVISTYVYRRGLMEANYSYGSAVSIFQAVFALILVVWANKMAQKMGQTSLW
ncbi:MAG: ABC transporter permease subunit [Eubacteriales bacterium]|nr:ABC transporter permease subunit [Eubacteriales bacterium]